MKKLRLLGLVGLMMIFSSSCGYISDFSKAITLNVVWAATSKEEIDKLLHSPSEIILENEKYTLESTFIQSIIHHGIVDKKALIIFRIETFSEKNNIIYPKYPYKFPYKPESIWIINLSKKVILKLDTKNLEIDPDIKSIFSFKDSSDLYNNYFYANNEKTHEFEYVKGYLVVICLKNNNEYIYIKGNLNH